MKFYPFRVGSIEGHLHDRAKTDFYPFRNGSIGAYGHDTERIKLHCFFPKTIGTVQVFVGSVPFLLCRVNAP